MLKCIIIFWLIFRIHARMQTTAKSFMQTIKETGQKLTGKNAEMREIPAMLVSPDVNVGTGNRVRKV